MYAYLLTRPEAWALSTLLHLPVQPGSVLNDWLGEEEISASTFSADDCLDDWLAKVTISHQMTSTPSLPPCFPAWCWPRSMPPRLPSLSAGRPCRSDPALRRREMG